MIGNKKQVTRNKIFILLLAIMLYSIEICYARATAENLADVEKLFMEEKYDSVITEAGKLIDAGAHGREELFYLKGLSQMQLNRFSPSRETFEYMVERYRRGKRAFDGYIAIGDSYFLEGKFNEALTAYNNALSKYPDHKNTSTVYYKLSNTYQKLGMVDKAKEYLNKVKSISPLSFESKMTPGSVPAKNIPAQENKIEKADAIFSVQVGYFKSKNNAEKLTAKLKQKGYDSYVSMQSKSSNTFYRVMVGHFTSRIDAESMSRKLKSDGYKTKVCR